MKITFLIINSNKKHILKFLKTALLMCDTRTKGITFSPQNANYCAPPGTSIFMLTKPPRDSNAHGSVRTMCDSQVAFESHEKLEAGTSNAYQPLKYRATL